MKASTVASALSCVLAAAASAFWLVVPAYTTARSLAVTASSGVPASSEGMTEIHRSLVAVNGWRVAWFLAIPVVIACVGFAVRRRFALIPAAVLLWLFVLATGFSIGLLYVPAAGAMAVAAVTAATETCVPHAR